MKCIPILTNDFLNSVKYLKNSIARLSRDILSGYYHNGILEVYKTCALRRNKRSNVQYYQDVLKLHSNTILILFILRLKGLKYTPRNSLVNIVL